MALQARMVLFFVGILQIVGVRTEEANTPMSNRQPPLVFVNGRVLDQEGPYLLEPSSLYDKPLSMRIIRVSGTLQGLYNNFQDAGPEVTNIPAGLSKASSEKVNDIEATIVSGGGDITETKSEPRGFELEKLKSLNITVDVEDKLSNQTNDHIASTVSELHPSVVEYYSEGIDEALSRKNIEILNKSKLSTENTDTNNNTFLNNMLQYVDDSIPKNKTNSYSETGQTFNKLGLMDKSTVLKFLSNAADLYYSMHNTSTPKENYDVHPAFTTRFYNNMSTIPLKNEISMFQNLFMNNEDNTNDTNFSNITLKRNTDLSNEDKNSNDVSTNSNTSGNYRPTTGNKTFTNTTDLKGSIDSVASKEFTSDSELNNGVLTVNMTGMDIPAQPNTNGSSIIVNADTKIDSQVFQKVKLVSPLVNKTRKYIEESTKISKSDPIENMPRIDTLPGPGYRNAGQIVLTSGKNITPGSAIEVHDHVTDVKKYSHTHAGRGSSNTKTKTLNTNISNIDKHWTEANSSKYHHSFRDEDMKPIKRGIIHNIEGQAASFVVDTSTSDENEVKLNDNGTMKVNYSPIHYHSSSSISSDQEGSLESQYDQLSILPTYNLTSEQSASITIPRSSLLSINPKMLDLSFNTSSDHENSSVFPISGHSSRLINEKYHNAVLTPKPSVSKHDVKNSNSVHNQMLNNTEVKIFLDSIRNYSSMATSPGNLKKDHHNSIKSMYTDGVGDKTPDLRAEDPLPPKNLQETIEEQLIEVAHKHLSSNSYSNGISHGARLSPTKSMKNKHKSITDSEEVTVTTESTKDHSISNEVKPSSTISMKHTHKSRHHSDRQNTSDEVTPEYTNIHDSSRDSHTMSNYLKAESIKDTSKERLELSNIHPTLKDVHLKTKSKNKTHRIHGPVIPVDNVKNAPKDTADLANVSALHQDVIMALMNSPSKLPSKEPASFGLLVKTWKKNLQNLIANFLDTYSRDRTEDSEEKN